MTEVSGEVVFEEDNDTVTESCEEAGIALPGHHLPPAAPYHGPAFPPSAPALMPSSDTVTSDVRHQDVADKKAVEWCVTEECTGCVQVAFLHILPVSYNIHLSGH